MYSDGPEEWEDCDDWTKDGRTSAQVTYVEGAGTVNLYPLCHEEVHRAPSALHRILEALQGVIGSN